jgi:hypothetical protein
MLHYYMYLNVLDKSATMFDSCMHYEHEFIFI